MKNQLKLIVEPVIHWYQSQEKNLPWKQDKEPYHIWISEIMLQQTRIETVKNYYIRFMEEVPTIKALANISEKKLLKLWEGLGYYSRAKNLKKAAIKIQEEYQGIIPNTYEELLKLPGIGEYTAGAIASISFQQKVPAVDGNVLRVISRVIAIKENIYLSDTKKEITRQIIQILPKESGDFNEGVMEIGEKICIPNGNPNCKECPIRSFCITNKNHLMDEIPVRVKKVKRKVEKKTILIIRWKDKIAIGKRKEKGLLSGLYEYPNVSYHVKEEDICDLLKRWNLTLKSVKKLQEKKHIFTHVEWQMKGYEVVVENRNDEFKWVNREELNQEYAIPTAFQKMNELKKSSNREQNQNN